MSMNYEYKKSEPVKLRNIGKDEKWLQDRVHEDPSILGLGDLSIIQREHPQPTGGRIDFLMSEPEEGVRYEIEIMLGDLDESHIIRTIEYWDVERKRFPSLEHVAVIVAENITGRFFNVVGLLNRAVPIMAIKLNAFLIDSAVILDFVKVLDIVREESEYEVLEQEHADRSYWENRSSKDSILVMDGIVDLLFKSDKEPRVIYNKYHVALRTTGVNFCWFHLRRGSYVFMLIKVGSGVSDGVIENLEKMGIHADRDTEDIIKFRISSREMEEHSDYLRGILLEAESKSQK